MRHNAADQLQFSFQKQESSPVSETEKQQTKRASGHWSFQNHKLLKGGQGGYQIHLPLQKTRLFERSGEYLPLYYDIWQMLHDYYVNPLSSAVCSNTLLLPHQVQAATHIVNSLRPRFLIADEVGLGKTIEAGLIIKELMLKYNYKSILICVPAPLAYQWQNELKSKFNENYAVVNSKVLNKNKLFLKENKKILVSIDFAKNDGYRQLFLEQKYDAIIFDEAHRLRKDANMTTKAYSFAEEIITKSLHKNGALLLMSATPFRGKLEELYHLIQLIDKDILGPLHTFINKYEEGVLDLKTKLKPVVIRRRKVDVGGFTKRFAKTIKVNLAHDERVFYDQTTEYVQKEYNMAMAKGSRMKGFVMIIFQKLLDSSSFALLKALGRRKEKIEKILFGNFISEQSLVAEDYLNLDDEDVLENENADFISEGIEFNPADMKLELHALNRLITLGSQIVIDSKLKHTSEVIEKIKKQGHEKIIIFTQFKSTLDYIYEHLAKKYKCCFFHGGLSAMAKEDVVSEFWGDSEILICTEAGGEGRNLQTASALINYDLPWSPLKIEQRIGRIHRFGQKKDVFVVNFACKDTVAEKVLNILDKKIQLFENALGPSDTLLGNFEEDEKVTSMILSFLKLKKTKKENQIELTRSIELAKENATKIDQLISTEFMNFNMQAFQEVVSSKKHNRLQEQRLLNVVCNYYQNLHLNYSYDNDIFHYQYKNEWQRGTFSAEKAAAAGNLDYLAIGHPLINRILQQTIKLCQRNGCYTAVAKNHSGGYLFLFKLYIHLDRQYKRYFSVYLDENFQADFITIPDVKSIQPQILDLEKISLPLEKALSQLSPLIDSELLRIRSRVEKGVLFWKDKVQESHSEKDGELNEKLALQKGKMKWYREPSMAGAITRTENQKQKSTNQKNSRISELNRVTEATVDLFVEHILEIRS